jgi:FkbM family methyltransferase
MLKKVKKAWSKGFAWTFAKLYWHCKFSFFRFFGVKKVISRYGVALHSDYSDATFKYYFLASYGHYYSEFLKDYSSSFVFIDIGANKGLYSILAAKNLNCERVISFEPIPQTFQYLQKNVVINEVVEKCELHNLAISDRRGEEKACFDAKHSGKASISPILVSNSTNFVEIQTADKNFLNELISPKINGVVATKYIVKIDVEGFELTVLKELFQCSFSVGITNIFYEVDEELVNPQLIENFLSDEGFKRFKKIGFGLHYDVMATRL